MSQDKESMIDYHEEMARAENNFTDLAPSTDVFAGPPSFVSSTAKPWSFGLNLHPKNFDRDQCITVDAYPLREAWP